MHGVVHCSTQCNSCAMLAFLLGTYRLFLHSRNCSPACLPACCLLWSGCLAPRGTWTDPDWSARWQSHPVGCTDRGATAASGNRCACIRTAGRILVDIAQEQHSNGRCPHPCTQSAGLPPRPVASRGPALALPQCLCAAQWASIVPRAAQQRMQFMTTQLSTQSMVQLL